MERAQAGRTRTGRRVLERHRRRPRACRLGLRGAALLALGLCALAFAAPASAGTIKVTTTFDELDGAAPCALREAVSSANANADQGGCTHTGTYGADTIKLAGGDYNLQRPGREDANDSGDLDVTESLAIVGAGADVSWIDGNGAITDDRVLQVSAGTLTISGLSVYDGFQRLGGGINGVSGTTLKLTDSTVTNNTAAFPVGGADALGGGIFTFGTANLTNSTVRGNEAVGFGGGASGSTGNGGGIWALTATLTDSTVSNNEAGGSASGDIAGGILADTATLTNSTVSDNHASLDVGGIYANTATLTDSTVSHNTAGRDGGGIIGAGTLTDSTVRRNEAGQDGGGIYTDLGSLTVTRSTISDNDSTNNGAGIFFTSPGTLNVINSTLSGNESGTWGGALSTDEGTTNLQSATINRNVADADAGGQFAGDGGGLDRFGTATVNLRNTILAGNLDRSAVPEHPDWHCDGGVVSEGYNLLSSTAGCAVAPATGDETAADPGLALLANNGGPTLTHALVSTSPAINAGHPAAPGSGSGACPSTDQRGVPRSLGGRCDKGAYERVSCHGKLVNRVGTGGADTLVGTSAADGILALGGNDVLLGRSAGDGLCGGGANDQLSGEAGPDFLDGGGGTDTCNGGTESDQAAGCETISSIP